MKRLFVVLPALAIVLLFTTSSLAQNQRGPSTPQERDAAVKIAGLLETDEEVARRVIDVAHRGARHSHRNLLVIPGI
jgi:hypothetical protein